MVNADSVTDQEMMGLNTREVFTVVLSILNYTGITGVKRGW